MEAYQRDDEQAFTELAEALSPTLRYFFSGPRATRRDVDDLLQDFWLRVHKSRHSYEIGRPVLPWILTIARYTRTDAYRRVRRREEHQTADAELLPDPKSQARAAEARADLRTLITALPPQQREVVVMLKLRGLSIKETARARNASIGATKQIAHRAYVKLRAWAQVPPGGPGRLASTPLAVA
jgi:RNA polymerase sigma-70 factor (ECF subfamily)